MNPTPNQQEQNELKPCPFCGTAPRTASFGRKVYCPQCVGLDISREHWNRRIAQNHPPDETKTNQAGFDIPIVDADETKAETVAERVLELSEKATPGPWVKDQVYAVPMPYFTVESEAPDTGQISEIECANEPDANLIAEYRTAAPELARANQQLQRRVAELEAKVATAHAANKEMGDAIERLASAYGITAPVDEVVNAAIQLLGVVESNNDLLPARNEHTGIADLLELYFRHLRFRHKPHMETLREAIELAIDALAVSRAGNENRGEYYDGPCSTALRQIRAMNVL